MPKQLVLLGRPVPRFGTRRLSFILIAISIFAVFSLIFTLPTAIPAGPSLSKTAHKFSMPKMKNPFEGVSSRILNPFRQPSHPPPRQKNDTYEESSWWADWKWLVPFSSTLTLDEDRSLLPPLKERPPIYCYYDVSIKKDGASKDAESELLLTWRRAWWAKGFRPIILGAAEAMNNPRYEELQRLELDTGMKTELMRWLAWENMGGGLLSQHTLLPMGPHEDPLLGYLRRGEYPRLTRWNDLDNGLFAGSKADVTAAIKAVLRGKLLKASQDIISASTPETFEVDDPPKALAYYDGLHIEKKYGKIAEAIKSNRAAGLKSLNQLINAHLHVTWQNVFSEGIAVLKPLPKHTTHLVAKAWALAQDLSKCSESPLPSSCPPNLPKCTPCVNTNSMRVTTPKQYHNVSNLYTIGTVPHPYTLASLDNMIDRIDVRWIRRQMKRRDPWLTAATVELFDTNVSGGPRIIKFKEAVAAEYATAHSLWLTSEKDPPADLHWHFGFAIPRNFASGKSQSPVPADRVAPPPSSNPGSDLPSPQDLEKEAVLVKKALRVHTGRGTDKRVRNAMEAWNLADTEAWKFARAFLARRVVERKEWEKSESKYSRGAGSEKGRRNRWLDKLEEKLPDSRVERSR